MLHRLSDHRLEHSERCQGQDRNHTSDIQLTQYRAQEMSIYLTMNGIPEKLIQARGYADQYDIAENSTVYGSAMNRRIVIQWSL